MTSSSQQPPEEERERHESGTSGERRGEARAYLRFIAMIATAMAAMFVLTYVNTFELSHVRWSETRVYMTLLMGGVMAIIMLSFMLGMYRNWKTNVAIVAGGLLMLGLGTYLVRSQTTVQDTSYMRAMIPHHSIAILTSENSEIDDIRVCELAVEIIEAQRREIKEMEWLIDDIRENGKTVTASEAGQRPVPEFEGTSMRSCPGQ